MPTIDNAGQSAGAVSTTSLSISSFAVGSGPNRVIYLEVSQYKSSDAVPTATFNGTENFVVHDGAPQPESPGTRRLTLLKLVAPSVTTAAINVQWGGASCDEAVIGAMSFTDVDQTTPFGTTVQNPGSGGSTSISIPSAATDIILASISSDAASSPSLTNNLTLRWRAIAAAGTTEGAGQTTAGTGSLVTSTFGNINGGFNGAFVHIGLAVKAAAGAPTPTQPPALVNPMRPFQGIIGRAALALRAFRAPQAVATASTSDTVTEALAATDTQSATAQFAGAQAETLAATDAQTGTVSFAGAASDTLSAADAQTGVANFAGQQSETLAATDAQTATAQFAGSVSESLNAQDSQSATVQFAGAVNESLAVSDAQTGAATFPVTRAEVLSAVDSQDATVTSGGTNVEPETLAATDAQSATVQFAGPVAESLSAVDTQSATALFPVARAETLAATDVQSATAQFAGPISEALTAADTQSATAKFAGIAQDTLSAADSQQGHANFAGAASDTLHAADSCDAIVITPGDATIVLLEFEAQPLPRCEFSQPDTYATGQPEPQRTVAQVTPAFTIAQVT